MKKIVTHIENFRWMKIQKQFLLDPKGFRRLCFTYFETTRFTQQAGERLSFISLFSRSPNSCSLKNLSSCVCPLHFFRKVLIRMKIWWVQIDWESASAGLRTNVDLHHSYIANIGWFLMIIFVIPSVCFFMRESLNTTPSSQIRGTITRNVPFSDTRSFDISPISCPPPPDPPPGMLKSTSPFPLNFVVWWFMACGFCPGEWHEG